MNKSWAANAAVSPPPAPSTPSIGYPTGGNPSTATLPTEPGAFWYHMVTMELLNIVTAAGITPSSTTVNQVLTALQTLFSSAGSGVVSAFGRTGAVVAASGDYSVGQVTGALAQAAFTGGNQSLASSGYQKLPGGLILQWGQVAIAAANASATFTYPITFPSAAVSLQVSMASDPYGGIAESLPVPSSVGLSSAVITNTFVGDNTGTSAAMTVNVFVLGY